MGKDPEELVQPKPLTAFNPDSSVSNSSKNATNEPSNSPLMSSAEIHA
jgi:hypothetical protein